MPEPLSLSNLNSFAAQIRSDQLEAIQAGRARYYTRAPVNNFDLDRMLEWQVAVRNALIMESNAVQHDPQLRKYALTREEIDKMLLSREDLQKIISYRNQYKVERSGRVRGKDRPFYFRSETELRKYLQNELNLPQGKIDLFITWAFADIDNNSSDLPRFQYFEARRLLYEYNSNRFLSGDAPFTKQELLRDFEDVIASYGHIKSFRTEQRKVHAVLQKILVSRAALDLDDPRDKERALQIEKNAKVYYRQQRRYYPEKAHDLVTKRITDRIIREKEKLKELREELDRRYLRELAEENDLTSRDLQRFLERQEKEIAKIEERIREYETELAKILEQRAKGISVPGTDIKNRDMSFDMFLRVRQEEIMNVTIQYENGLISKDVWLAELKRLFQNEVYLYGLIKSGGIYNLDWEEMDRLAWHLKNEIRRLSGFADFVSLFPSQKQDLLGYTLSVPIKIILDDINLSLLSQLPYESLAIVLNSNFREIGRETLSYLRGKNSDYFDYLAGLPVDISISLSTKTVTNWLQGQVNSYIFSLEDSARRLRASKDWLRYTWDPVLHRYVARGPIGISPRQMLTMLRDNPIRFMYIMYGKSREADLSREQLEQFQKIQQILQQYIKANKLGMIEIANAHIKEFEKIITPEQLERINPGIRRVDPKTGRRFFIGKFFKANQLLSDEDTINFNRLLLLERKLDLEKSGKYGLASTAQNLSEWSLDVAKRLKKYHIFSYALGSGLNPTQFRQGDYNRIIDALTTQYQYLRDFVFDILNDATMSESRFLMRLMQYASTTAISYYMGQLESHLRAKFQRAKRVLADGEACSGCVQEAAKGWVPIDNIVPIGSIGPCFFNCRCRIEYER